MILTRSAFLCAGRQLASMTPIERIYADRSIFSTTSPADLWQIDPHDGFAVRIIRSINDEPIVRFGYWVGQESVLEAVVHMVVPDFDLQEFLQLHNEVFQ